MKLCIPPTCIPPPFGVFKLNFDSSALGNLGIVGLGSLVRDSNREILLSYSGPASLCSVNRAKSLALLAKLRQGFTFP